jgi:hypothetical protein
MFMVNQAVWEPILTQFELLAAEVSANQMRATFRVSTSKVPT